MTHQLFSAIDKIFHSHPQRGAILVLFAITFPFLMAFSAIAVDLGTVYVQRVHLQNAADAAALAGAWQLGNSSDDPAVNSSVAYTQNNSPSDITVTSSDSTMPSEEKQINLYSNIQKESSYSTIEVQLRERVPLYFFRYFGMENMPIAVTATAKYVPGDNGTVFNGIFDYALMAGSQNNQSIFFQTPGISIDGDVRTNGQIYMYGQHYATVSGSVIGNSNLQPIWGNYGWYNNTQGTSVQGYFTTANSSGTDSSVSYPSSLDISINGNSTVKNYINNIIDTTSNMSTSDKISNYIYYGSGGNFYTDSNGDGTITTGDGSSYTGLTDGTITNTSTYKANPYSTIVTTAQNVSVSVDANHTPTDTTVIIATQGTINATINASTPGKSFIIIAEGENANINLQVYGDSQIIAYAPNGTITVNPAANIYGSLVANRITTTGTQKIIHQTITAPGSSSSSTKASVTLIQ